MIRKYITARFNKKDLKKYLLIQYGVFLILLFLAWITFNMSNHFTIMEHTFSFLGSWDPDHNPIGWYFFTIALLWWGFLAFPLVFYIHRRYSKIATAYARFISLLFIIGVIGMILVAIFPDAQSEITDGTRFTDIHGRVSLLAFGGFGLGILFSGLLVAKDRFSWFPHGGQKLLNHKKIIWPYLLFVVMFFTATYFLIKWEYVYPVLKEQNPNIGSHWSAALNTIYSFPLWENLLIYTLMIFWAWLVLILPEEDLKATFTN